MASHNVYTDRCNELIESYEPFGCIRNPNILKIIILATASSSLFQSYPNLKNTDNTEEILFTGGLNTIIEIILECRTLEVVDQDMPVILMMTL